ASTSPTAAKEVHPAPSHRATRKPDSSLLVSFQASATVLSVDPVTVRAVGADGGKGDGGSGSVSPEPAKTEAVKLPAPEKDSTRSVHVPAAALATPRVSKRPGAAQLPFVDSSMQRLTATVCPLGFTR